MFCMHCGSTLQETAAFCTNCGKATKKPDSQESVTRVQNEAKKEVGQDFINQEKTVSSDDTNLSKVLGSNATYYIREFECLQTSDVCKWNLAALFLGPFHAAYRNVWKEWFLFMMLPLIAVGVDLLILTLAAFSASTQLLTLGAIAGLLAAILSFIWQAFRYPKHFNRIYWAHVTKKLSSGNLRPDPSILRVILTAAACIGLSFALSLLKTFSTLSMLGAYEDEPMEQPEVTVPAPTEDALNSDSYNDAPTYEDTGNSLRDYLAFNFFDNSKWISGTDYDSPWFTIKKNNAGAYTFTIYEPNLYFRENDSPVEIDFLKGKAYGVVYLSTHDGELCEIDISFDDSGEIPVLTLLVFSDAYLDIPEEYFCESFLE